MSDPGVTAGSDATYRAPASDENAGTTRTSERAIVLHLTRRQEKALRSLLGDVQNRQRIGAPGIQAARIAADALAKAHHHNGLCGITYGSDCDLGCLDAPQASGASARGDEPGDKS